MSRKDLDNYSSPLDEESFVEFYRQSLATIAITHLPLREIKNCIVEPGKYERIPLITFQTKDGTITQLVAFKFNLYQGHTLLIHAYNGTE